MTKHDVDAPDPILADDSIKRLDALLRRHGGKAIPKPIRGRVVLPPIGRRECEGQESLPLDAGDER